MSSIFFYRLKTLIILLIIGCASTLPAQINYNQASYDFGLRAGIGTLSGINNTAYPLFDISSDFYFLSSYLRMIFGVSFIYPNNASDGFSVAGLQYLGLEYNIPFLKNVAQIGIKINKTYIKATSSDLEGNRSVAMYLGYKHPVRDHMDYYIQFGVIRKPVKSASGDIPVDSYCAFLQTGVEVYF